MGGNLESDGDEVLRIAFRITPQKRFNLLCSSHLRTLRPWGPFSLPRHSLAGKHNKPPYTIVRFTPCLGTFLRHDWNRDAHQPALELETEEPFRLPAVICRRAAA